MKRILVLFFCIHPFMFSETELYFINIENGDVLQNPILVQFGLRGKGVAPAGVDIENTGHHHLLINIDKIDLKEPIPASKNHIHFGGGQTETFLNLPAGQHSLQLLLGNKYHIPHSPAVISEKIKVTVTE